MKEIDETEKKKRLKNDSRTLITFGTGFILVVLVEVISGEYLIHISDLALLGMVMIILGRALPGIVEVTRKYQEQRTLKKYDTGLLAQIDTE